ncbi:hypothetical protein MMPV_006820 [Pyropia vietnamensis]
MWVRVEALAHFITTHAPVTLLSGAGLSTPSGIPCYRDHGRSPAVIDGTVPPPSPMTADAFAASAATRRRYWARSYVGYPRTVAAVPSAGHLAAVALTMLPAGLTTAHVTQNVDGLLGVAGGGDAVVELHGSVHRVVCMDCGARSSRAELQADLARLNPGWPEVATATTTRPDGDAELPSTALEYFVMAPCRSCGSTERAPDLVFFGGSLRPDIRAAAAAAIDASHGVLGLGSSFTVYSAYGLLVRSAARGGAVALLNYGATRADGLAALKVEARVDHTLAAVAALLGAGGAGGDGGSDDDRLGGAGGGDGVRHRS